MRETADEREAGDYDSPEDALASAAAQIGAEWYIRRGDQIEVFMRTRDGYAKAELFKKGGWYHWPTDWPDHVRNLPADARLVPDTERGAAEENSRDSYEENPRGPKCGPERGAWRHRGGCCPGRPHCRVQRREAGICYCEAYHYPHRVGSGRCLYGPEGPERMDRFVYGPRRNDEASEAGREGSESREAREQEAPAGEAAAVPWLKLGRDPERYRRQMDRAKAIGEVANARAIYDMLAPTLAEEDQEVFLVVAIDARKQCRDVVEVHRGGQSRVAVEIPVIMRAANAIGGEMFVVVHNHPTGNAKPSSADRRLTKAIEKAAKTNELVFMDHVVVGLDQYFSFADEALVKVPRPPSARASS